LFVTAVTAIYQPVFLIRHWRNKVGEENIKVI
jgi:hypothetical protein